MIKHPLPFYFKTKEDICVHILFFICFLLFWCNPLSADTTYKLVQVTSVSAGGKYVFEQDGYVMSNSISSGSLQTTNSYNTTGLTGTEAYVWTLEVTGNAGRYYMKNVNISKYLNNGNSTTMSFENSKSSIWSFSFDGTATIRNTSNSDYYLAYTGEPSTHVYRAYSSASYAHAITVYKLESEKVDPTTKWYMNNTKSEELSYKSVYKSEGICEFYLYTNSTGTVTYTSSDEDVATIDEDGKITPLGYGTITITATTAANENFNSSSASFILSVGNQYVDVLDVYNTDNTTGSYKSFADLTINSGAKYMGYTSCVGGALRVNSNYTNCIAVSSTAGIVKSVSVKWNSNTTNGRVLTVYGRNVAYSDLNTSTYVTKLGTITYGTNSSLDLTSKATDYGYVGLSASGALLVDYIVVEWEPPVTIILPEAGKGYKTFCYPKALDFSGVSGLTAYTATVDNGIALFTPIEGKLPACTGLLLTGEVNTPYEVPCVATSNTDVSTNVMVGVTEATNVAAGIYVLMNVNDNVCFYKTSTTFTVGANTAYIPSGVSESKSLNISIVDVSAGMSKGFYENQDNDIIYNVAGQMVGKDYKGMVVKGRKLYLQK